MYIYMCLLSGAADHCEFRVCQSDCPKIIGGHTVLYQRCLDLESEIEITAVLALSAIVRCPIHNLSLAKNPANLCQF